MTGFLLFLALLVVFGGLLVRWRLRQARKRGLTEEMVRRIEEEGQLRWEDEELDMEAIREEEDRFWEQSWDEPEPL